MEKFPVFINADHLAVTVWTTVVPRAGDKVMYWIDEPKYIKPEHDIFIVGSDEPVELEGTVSEVRVEFRRMRYEGQQEDKTHVSITLEDYTARFPTQHLS